MNAYDETGLAIELRRSQFSAIEKLFDTMENVAFFVKDCEGRYVIVNHTMVRRLAVGCKQNIIGKTALDLHPRHLAETYTLQDIEVFERGVTLSKHLELHLYPNRHRGWCITHKTPLLDQNRKIIGLAGTSLDLGLPDEIYPVYHKIAEMALYIRENFRETISLNQLAIDANLSMSRVERLFQRVFQFTPRQLLLQSRINGAVAMLESTSALTIAEIAYACGYADHSAFSRQFKALTGLSPVQYRSHFQLAQSRAPFGPDLTIPVALLSAQPEFFTGRYESERSVVDVD